MRFRALSEIETNGFDEVLEMGEHCTCRPKICAWNVAFMLINRVFSLSLRTRIVTGDTHLGRAVISLLTILIPSLIL